jgi:hypothetical protein
MGAKIKVSAEKRKKGQNFCREKRKVYLGRGQGNRSALFPLSGVKRSWDLVGPLIIHTSPLLPAFSTQQSSTYL